MMIDRTQVSLEDVFFRLGALAQLRDSSRRKDRKYADAILYTIVLPGLREIVDDEGPGFDIEEFRMSGDVYVALRRRCDPCSEIPTTVGSIETFLSLYEKLLDYNENQAASKLAECCGQSMRHSYVLVTSQY